MNFRSLFIKSFIFLILFTSTLSIYSVSFAETKEEQEARWRAELEQTEKDIAKWQDILNNTKQGTATLQKEASALNAKIQQAKAFIKSKNIAIEKLRGEIDNKNKTINTLERKIEKSKESLSQLIRKTNETDSYSIVEVFLANRNISEFFSSVDSYNTINKSLSDLLEDIRQTKNLTEKEKDLLNKKKDQETDLKENVEDEKVKIEKNEKEKQYLIKVNKTQEKTYEQVIKERQAKASEIRAKLFQLAGGSAAIPFGTALAYAQTASSKTGVSPAFVLAILTKESSLGANVGRCYVTDINNGSGISVSGNKIFSNVMKSPRDTNPFLKITERLGFDPYKTPISCPIAGVAGYGGAMGPAQFIPSTWALLEDRLKDTLGRDSNPWNAEDAFMASSMYLSDLGASGGSYSKELRAACSYYGTRGSTCSYGRSVMQLRQGIQDDIDYLNQYGVSRR